MKRTIHNHLPVLALFVALASGCGRGPSYNLDEAGTSMESNAALSSGVSLCDQSKCPKMDLVLDVQVPSPGAYDPSTNKLILPAGAQSQIRLQAVVTDRSVMRAAALLFKNQVSWLTGAPGKEGVINVTAAPPANANANLQIQMRDMSYCKVKARKASDCNDPSIPNEADKYVSLTIIASGSAQGTYSLPADQRCANVPQDTRQNLGGLDSIFQIGSALITGNFLPVITNVAGGLLQGNNSSRPPGC